MTSLAEVLAPKARPKPTEEQTAIIKMALESKDSLLINALAGAAKTTTLEMICAALPPQPILCLAFNKRIQQEMEKRLPGHVKCQTLNSVGHGVWAKACVKKLTLNTKKTYEILKAKGEGLKRAEKEEYYENFSQILKAISIAKLKGYIPPEVTMGKRLIEEEFWYSEFFEEEPSDFFRTLVDEVLIESIKQSYNGTIDFDDQIYMPTLFGGTFPQFPLVMVDEAQDLSSLNHAMLDKLVTNRIIAVGDPWQSIYGFRGAVANGMSSLSRRFQMVEMGLSISFRCPKAVVRNARFRAPHMQWPEWAKEGRVASLEEWSSNEIPESAAIICRNNAPLFKCAFRLLAAGRGIEMVGMDIGAGLVRILKKLGPSHTTQDAVYAYIDRWESETLAKSRAKASTKDKAECLRVFASFGTTLGAAIAYAEAIFAAKGPIQLLSGHKSKGLEWDTVYHLDPWRIPSIYATEGEALEQEMNVRYVIETRAKDSLFLVTTDGFRG